MKKALALFAVAGAAAAANAQVDAGGAVLARVVVSNDLPANGEIVNVDIVFDATDFAPPFFAWHQYNFDILLNASGDVVSAASISAADEPGASAPSDTTGDGVENFGPFGGPWSSGRRPGAFPGAAAAAGGNQFGPSSATNVQDGVIGSLAGNGTVGGRQAAFTTPENNFNIHRGREYAAFRFSFQYFDANQIVEISLARVILNIYPTDQSAFNEFLSNFNTQGATVGIPAPASAALLGLGGLVAARRRR